MLPYRIIHAEGSNKPTKLDVHQSWDETRSRSAKSESPSCATRVTVMPPFVSRRHHAERRQRGRRWPDENSGPSKNYRFSILPLLDCVMPGSKHEATVLPKRGPWPREKRTCLPDRRAVIDPFEPPHERPPAIYVIQLKALTPHLQLPPWRRRLSTRTIPSLTAQTSGALIWVA